MSADDICWLDASAIVEKVRLGGLTAEAVVSAVLERIEAVDPKINAFTTVASDQALEAARRSFSGEPRVAWAATLNDLEREPSVAPQLQRVVEAARSVTNQPVDHVSVRWDDPDLNFRVLVGADLAAALASYLATHPHLLRRGCAHPAVAQRSARMGRVSADFAEHDAQGSALTMRGVQARRPSIYDLEESLRRMDVPVLIIAGDEDDHCLQPGLFLKRMIPASGLAILPKTGHTINLDEPAMFNMLVADFLAQVEQGRWLPRDPRSNPAEIVKTK